MSAKILLLDLETAPILMAAWRQWDTSAVYVMRNTYILMYAFQWVHEGKTICRALPDYDTYEADKHSDRVLCEELRILLDEADVVVAHNGDSFDLPLVLGRFFVHGIAPPSPTKQVDTRKIAKNMRLDSRKLDALGEITGVGSKIPNEGAKLWEDVVEHHCPKAWAKMTRYCKQDVNLLARVYPLLRPYSKPSQHPDLTMWTDRPGCPACESPHVKKQGFRVLRTRKVQQWQCQAEGCGIWF